MWRRSRRRRWRCEEARRRGGGSPVPQNGELILQLDVELLKDLLGASQLLLRLQGTHARL